MVATATRDDDDQQARRIAALSLCRSRLPTGSLGRPRLDGPPSRIGGPPVTDLKTGILLWSQARQLARDARCGEAGRSARVRPPVDLGPPLRDLRRPVPADRRGLDHARRRGRWRPSGRASACSSAPTRSAIPGSTAKMADDARPHQRRPRHPRHRRRLVRARASGPRHRLRVGLRAAARLDGRGGRRRMRDRARRRVGHLAAGRALRLRRPPPPAAPDPAAAPDHDRRQRREEDAADGREVRRHVERHGPARA